MAVSINSKEYILARRIVVGSCFHRLVMNDDYHRERVGNELKKIPLYDDNIQDVNVIVDSVKPYYVQMGNKQQELLEYEVVTEHKYFLTEDHSDEELIDFGKIKMYSFKSHYSDPKYKLLQKLHYEDATKKASYSYNAGVITVYKKWNHFGELLYTKAVPKNIIVPDAEIIPVVDKRSIIEKIFNLNSDEVIHNKSVNLNVLDCPQHNDGYENIFLVEANDVLKSKLRNII